MSAQAGDQQATELPGAPWFALSHYRGINEWTPAEWFAAIACRQAIQLALRDWTGTEQDIARQWWSAHWYCIAVDPIHGTGMSHAVQGRSNAAEIRVSGRRRGALVRQLDDLEPDEARDEIESLRGQDFTVLAIDLKGSNAELREAFAVWLESVRPGKPVAQVMTPADINHWRRCSAMPATDLLLWERATGRKLSKAAMARALYSGVGAKAADERLASARRYAELFLDQEFFESIAAKFATPVHR